MGYPSSENPTTTPLDPFTTPGWDGWLTVWMTWAPMRSTSWLGAGQFLMRYCRSAPLPVSRAS